MTFPFCEIIGKKLRSISVRIAGEPLLPFERGRRKTVEGLAGENKELETAEEEEYEEPRGREAVEKGTSERDGRSKKRERCLFFTIEAHCS